MAPDEFGLPAEQRDAGHDLRTHVGGRRDVLAPAGILAC
jgi:hypothetical protein